MQLLEDGIIAALAAVGLVTLLFLLISAIAHPRCKGTLDATVIVPCRGSDGVRLEQTVRILERVRCETGGFRKIMILDRGMDEDTQKVATLLCKDDFDVTICNNLLQLNELE